ncbi:MAG: hypothetical protein GY744_06795 [Gammaproteobacteria bacterium]|nr:hypothetical protein [Gammaproteobacteria bacterium]
MSGPLSAFSEYCANRLEPGYVEIAYAEQQNSQVETATEVDISSAEANVAWLVSEKPGHSLSFGIETLYSILGLNLTSPMTNGHLHTWGFPLTASYNNNDVEVLYNLTPAISVSSNALKNPQLINKESLQLKTKLVYKKTLSDKYSWVFGFMSDYRFGDYRLYPLAGVCLQPSQDWLLQLTVPDFSIRKTLSSAVNLIFYASPEGNKWHVFSKDLQNNSDLRYHTIITGIAIEWFITPSIMLGLDLEQHNSSDFSLALEDESLIQFDTESRLQFRLRGKVLF